MKPPPTQFNHNFGRNFRFHLNFIKKFNILELPDFVCILVVGGIVSAQIGQSESDGATPN